jgi:hypothetical protein
MNITFTSKETYLQWRSDWKARYKLVSQNIRDLKLIRREECRARAATAKLFSTMTYPTPDFDTVFFARLHDAPGYEAAYSRAKRLGLESQRDEARTLLFMLEQAKVEAQVQYLAAHAQAVPA